MFATFEHLENCLPCYLSDHHTREGECLFGVSFDHNSTYATVKAALIDEVRASGDRVPGYVLDSDISEAIERMLPESERLLELFDTSIDLIVEEAIAEAMGGEETPQAWFLLTWETPID